MKPIVMTLLGAILFGLGALITCNNFYLSFLRYPLFRLLGRNYQYVSVVPLIGSILLLVAAFLLRNAPLWSIISLVLALFDTGGLHFFVFAMLWMFVWRILLGHRPPNGQ